MPIAAPVTIAVALVATIAGAADEVPVTMMPPMAIDVRAEADVPPSLLAIMLAETDSVWRASGIQFVWHQEAWQDEAHEHKARGGVPREDAARARLAQRPRRGLGRLRVVIGHDTHSVEGGRLPLGWVIFDGAAMPEPELYVSYANAVSLLEQSSGVVGPTQGMPRLKRDTLLGRAMGRALAHELGHYLSGSKRHSEKGLMMAVHSAWKLFGSERTGFSLEPAERAGMLARFTSIYMASRS